jgi:S-adenosylmethionine synthetase
MDVRITPLDFPRVSSAPLEIVERKGVGHPDSICDGVVEAASIALARHYLDRFGAILHHNLDKALLVGGTAQPAFGGGSVLEPIEIDIAGRATFAFQSVSVPVDDIAIDAARAWLRGHLRELDADRHVRIRTRIRPTSPDLTALFARQFATGVPLANDTSFGAGFAPLDALERAVLQVDSALGEARTAHAEIGEDVKVMGVRDGASMRLTVACALVGRHLRDVEAYFASKGKVRALAADAAARASGMPVEIAVNTADGDDAGSV